MSLARLGAMSISPPEGGRRNLRSFWRECVFVASAPVDECDLGIRSG